MAEDLVVAEIEDNVEQTDYDNILPVVPLRGIMIFPYMVTHLDVGRSYSLAAVEECVKEQKPLVLVAQKEGSKEDVDVEDLYEIGVIVKIQQTIKLPGGGQRVLVRGLKRIKVTNWLETSPCFRAEYEELETPEILEESYELEALGRTVERAFERYMALLGKAANDTIRTILEVEDWDQKLDLMAAYLHAKPKDKQGLLEASVVEERMQVLYTLMVKEAEFLTMEKKINDEVKKNVDQAQKEYYLKEKMKVISQELGEGEDKLTEVQEFKDKIKAANMPEEIEVKALKEVSRLARTTTTSPEYTILRNYIEWLVDLPWSVTTEDRLDINFAKETLDKDHYGLEKIKERILEFLAVRQLKSDTKGPIICLVGPPGVGKTSLAKSIAEALDKKFIRMSLGGVRDEAEIRGHRRTYVGAMPGRIIQGINNAGTKNPVFLLDEIDKMAMDGKGDPASALLEVLDPQQNNTFSDHFIELPFDLSQVMFVTTANTVHEIPRPLLDRMEVISLGGYTEEEKVQIAIRYLVPKQREEHGLAEDQLQLSANTVLDIVRYYTKEAGVRNLERQVAHICRKAAKTIVESDKKSIRVNKQNLAKFLGKPRYKYGIIESDHEVGVATGLAWTSVGGDILQIEVSVLPGKGKLLLTGKLGDVMKESAQAGYSYIRSKAEELGIASDFNEKKDIHIHVPEGAIPKDGPSAGITMATAMASALTNRQIRNDVAMTGEITLRGKVLPVGGIKEKVLAAHRAGIKTIVLSHENEKDLEDIPSNVQSQLEFHLVKNMDEVLTIALLGENN